MKLYNIDKSAKTVFIPVSVCKDKICYFYGEELPKLRDGAMAELRLLGTDILDVKWIDRLNHEQRYEILPTGAPLVFSMRAQHVPKKLKDRAIRMDHKVFGEPTDTSKLLFVHGILRSSLEIIFRGTKLAVLSGGACDLLLLNKASDSVNEACTIASTICEPSRRSHSANVFEYVHYYDPDSRKWWPLSRLRTRFEAEYEFHHLLSDEQKQHSPLNVTKKQADSSSLFGDE